jgi:mRNA interferase HigB
MRIIARRTLLNFVASCSTQRDHKALKSAVDVWFHTTRTANWRTSADIKQTFNSASIVTADRIVFNIKGNDYRLVVSIDFEKQIVWIKWIGRHSDYDEIDVTAVQHGD